MTSFGLYKNKYKFIHLKRLQEKVLLVLLRELKRNQMVICMLLKSSIKTIYQMKTYKLYKLKLKFQLNYQYFTYYQIDHSNVVKLYEIYEDDTNFYMVLELMTGGELFERIVEKDHFSEKEAAATLRPIIDALTYCHKMGIEPGALLKVSDFGLARFVTNDEVMMTQCGTPGYVATEILSGHGYSEAIDFWSVGVILYIMLCGFPPFYDEDNDKLFKIIKTGQFSFPFPYWDSISNEGKDDQTIFLKLKISLNVYYRQLIKLFMIVQQISTTNINIIQEIKIKIIIIITVDPSKRFGTEKIMKHPWLVNNTAKSIPNIQNKMKEFYGSATMKKMGIFVKLEQRWGKLSQLYNQITLLYTISSTQLSKFNIQLYKQILQILEFCYKQLINHLREKFLLQPIKFTQYIYQQILSLQKIKCLNYTEQQLCILMTRYAKKNIQGSYFYDLSGTGKSLITKQLAQLY